jgi:hypothetical protein
MAASDERETLCNYSCKIVLLYWSLASVQKRKILVEKKFFSLTWFQNKSEDHIFNQQPLPNLV